MNNNKLTNKSNLSPIGFLPIGWNLIELKQIVLALEAGVSVNSCDEIDMIGGLYILKTSAVQGGKFIPSECKIIAAKDVPRAKLNPQKNSIIISRMNTPDLVGECGYVERTYDNLFLPDRLWQTRFHDESQIDVKWLNYLLNTTYYRLQIKNIATGTSTSMKNIAQGAFLSMKIPLPPLKEQSSIASLLSTWDKAIELNTKLLQAKQQRKKWLMQVLLTGKKRLPGFEGEWKRIKLGDAFEFIKSFAISRDGLHTADINDSINCVHYGDIHALYEGEFLDFRNQQGIPQLLNKNIGINSKDYLKDGDIIMADASEDYEGVGEAIEVKNLGEKTAVGGLHTIVLRDMKGISTEFFRAYLFASEPVRNELRKKATGTSVYSVAKSTLQNLTLVIPSSEEQIAIARILISADYDIESTKKVQNQLVVQWKGLMQVLLTGKKRLNTHPK